MFKYNDQYLELVNKFSYLGIVFTPGGSFKIALETLSGAALKAIFKLKSYLIKFPDLKTSYMLDLFDKLVVPVLSYDSEIWAYTNVDVLERICLRFYKHVLGITLQSQTIFVHGELGTRPIKNKLIVNMIRYWIKVVNMNDNKYVTMVYNMLLNDLQINENKMSWVSGIRNTLQSLGLNDAWIFQTVGNKTLFLELV